MKKIEKCVGILFVVCLFIMCTAGCGVKESSVPTTAAMTEAATEAMTEPQRVEMSTPDLAEYVLQRTVTITVTDKDGNTSSGSGFFIDNKGTIVTCYHVIDAADVISAEVSDGGKYDVKTIVDFNEVYDIAILKVDVEDSMYMETCHEKSRTGETVYAVGTSLGFLNGTFSNGIISNASRSVGAIDCIQTTAAISDGNSGGPLVNVYGEVIGINAISYTDGENLNLSIDMNMLQMLNMDKNWNMSQYKEWYKKEIDRSYKAWNYTSNEWELTKVNTYQHVTGQKCCASDYNYDFLEGDTDSMVEGYDENKGIFFYAYDVNEFDSYTAYLSTVGFTFQKSEDYNEGIVYYYENEFTGHKMDLLVLDGSEYIVSELYCK